MPVYNTKEEYLRVAIESILNQTYSDFEFIIINDGSINNAEEVILSYSDDRIVYFKQENQGCTFIHPSIMFRKKDFDKYNLRYTEEAKYAEDYLLYSKAVTQLKMTNLQEVLLNYRVYPENSSSSNIEQRVRSSFFVQDFILDCISNDAKERKVLLDLAYKNKTKTINISEKLFSLKNLYKNWAKYKLITVLGLEFMIKVKEYKKGE